jgi:hypothetical protein
MQRVQVLEGEIQLIFDDRFLVLIEIKQLVPPGLCISRGNVLCCIALGDVLYRIWVLVFVMALQDASRLTCYLPIYPIMLPLLRGVNLAFQRFHVLLLISHLLCAEPFY